MSIVNSPVLANIASDIISTTFLNQNSARSGAVIVNDSTANLFINFGDDASLTSFIYKLTAGERLQITSAMLWQGKVNGIWDAANGFARVTEFT